MQDHPVARNSDLSSNPFWYIYIYIYTYIYTNISSKHCDLIRNTWERSNKNDKLTSEHRDFTTKHGDLSQKKGFVKDSLLLGNKTNFVLDFPGSVDSHICMSISIFWTQSIQYVADWLMWNPHICWPTPSKMIVVSLVERIWRFPEIGPPNHSFQ